MKMYFVMVSDRDLNKISSFYYQEVRCVYSGVFRLWDQNEFVLVGSFIRWEIFSSDFIHQFMHVVYVAMDMKQYVNLL